MYVCTDGYISDMCVSLDMYEENRRFIDTIVESSSYFLSFSFCRQNRETCLDL